jgi:nitrate/TMAO reductase-like tetraheme cytochrome c subunit
MRSFLRTLLSMSIVHWLTSVGAVLTTASAAVFLLLFFQRFNNPYAGIILFLIVPALFVLGLILMPTGIGISAKRAGGYSKLQEGFPGDHVHIARVGWLFAFATTLNVAILMLATYRGVEVMDSSQFCGETCHSAMQPQYIRYQKSPHARVACVDCHVGSGATSFVQYKLAGVRQLIRLTTNTYHRPIPPAIDRMRPAAELCEQCHSRGKAQEDRLKVIRHFAEDEQSTEKVTVLLMKVGSSIHKAHVGSDIRYEGDAPDPQTISSVTSNGKTYTVEGAKPGAATRTMDCMDCHNRSGHDFETADSAVDRALATAQIDRSRPFARRDALAALKAESGLETQPAAIQLLRSENVYSQMKVGWGTYPNNIGHDKFPGCFRCHDGQHVTKSGNAITQDCDSCHVLVAVDEEKPKILKELGLP